MYYIANKNTFCIANNLQNNFSKTNVKRLKLCISDACGRLSEVPSNIAVIVGSRSTLCCRTDREDVISWHYTQSLIGDSASSQNLRHFYNGFSLDENLNKEFAIDQNNPGQFNLVINFTSPSHAGTYTCEEGGSRQNASSEIVVLGKNLHTKYMILWPHLSGWHGFVVD